MSFGDNLNLARTSRKASPVGSAHSRKTASPRRTRRILDLQIKGFEAGLRRLDRRLAGLVAWKQLDLKGASDFGWKGCKRDNLDKLQSQSGKREQTLEDSQSGARAGEPVLGESRGFQSNSVQQRAADKVDGDLAMVVGRVAEARQVGSAFTFAN